MGIDTGYPPAYFPSGPFGPAGPFDPGVPGLGGGVLVVPQPFTSGTHPVAVGAISGTSTIAFASGGSASATGASRSDPAGVSNNYRTGGNQTYSGRLAAAPSPGGGSGPSANANTGTGGGGGAFPGGAGGAGGSGIVIIRVRRSDIH